MYMQHACMASGRTAIAQPAALVTATMLHATPADNGANMVSGDSGQAGPASAHHPSPFNACSVEVKQPA